MESSRPMMAITTSSSIKVKAGFGADFVFIFGFLP
jgi:hypothetical protein